LPNCLVAESLLGVHFISVSDMRLPGRQIRCPFDIPEVLGEVDRLRNGLLLVAELV
jgi:hypothetical protein